MSGVAARVGSADAPLPAGQTRAEPLSTRDSTLVKLAAFLGLAAYGAGHWALLVENADGGRVVAEVAIATSGAGALALLPGLRLNRRALALLAAVLTLATLAAGLVAAGLEGRLLLPGHWDELTDGIDRGLGGVTTISWPYAGPDEWIRLTILLGAPLLLALAAALAFWPARRAAKGLRIAALITLLVLYGTAVTEHDPGSNLLRGLGLFVLIGAWLWLPRLGQREALGCAGLIAVAGVLALPVAAKLDGEQPWLDYRSWEWFGGGRTVSYSWDHRYGPLDWPRDGTTLLNVESRRALYWKTETLDSFDGRRWLRTRANNGDLPTLALPPRLEPRGRSWDYFEFNPRWDERIRVTVRALESSVVVGAGTAYDVQGAGSVATTGDGTLLAVDEPLRKGDSYTVRAYVPNPTRAQMRRTPAGYPAALRRETSILLPGPDSSLAAITMPLWGEPRAGVLAQDNREALLASPYAGVYRLVERLTADQATSYDAVAAVSSYLQRNLDYDERPPERRYPLAAFVLQDKVGYCQQFSGALALMLRMAGIPARVATGFSPGSFNAAEREYRVRDLDAHSWVEVYFTGIGWVTFDPTPQGSPAESRASGREGRDAAGVFNNPSPGADSGASAKPKGGGSAAGGGSEGGGPSPWLVLPLLLLAGGTFACFRVLRARRSRAELPATAIAGAHLRELEAALRRLGWRLPAGLTLLRLERLLSQRARPVAASYAAALRANRYASGAPLLPGPEERRGVRGELAQGAGLRGRLRAWLAIPPGGPRI